MNKKFLSKLVVASVLVGGINFLLVPNIDAGNFQISVAYAENKNFAAKEAAMTDVEIIEAQAKEASRMRAIEAVKEKIASYVRNFAGAKGKLTEDDISAIAEKFEQVGETKYQKLFYNAVDEADNELGKVGIMYEATVTAKFNSKKITEHIKLTEQEKAKRIRQAKESRAKFEELDREYEELRKNARTKTPEQLQAEIKNFDDKLSDLEKRKDKNKSAKKDKPKTQQDKIQPMKISSPVEIGKFGWNMRIGGIFIKDATYVSEQPKKTYDTLTYSNGVARFGKGDEALYLHYDMKSQPAFKIGSEDIKNTVPYSFVWSSILKLNANNGYTMYLIRKDYDIPEPYKQYVLIGRRPDGRWVKYFDIDELCNQYIGKNANVAIQKITFNGDTIIAQYARCNYPKDNNFYASKANEFGEFRFKWDESAKWFGVEKITYNQTPTTQKPVKENKPVTNTPMKFSQPVKLGGVFGTPQGGFVINGATQNNGDLFKMRNGKVVSWEEFDTKTKQRYKVNVYGKGTAKFGNGDDALYFYYDFYKYGVDYGKGRGGNYQEGAKNGAKFGGKNSNNLFSISQQIYETSCTFEKIPANNNLTLYMLIYHAQVGGSNYILIGKKSDGTWVKYFDMEDMNIQYFGLTKNDYGTTIVNRVPHYYTNYYCQDDTINVEYESFNRTLRKNVKVGAFRFKWDEKAQWFSVEQIKY